MDIRSPLPPDDDEPVTPHGPTSGGEPDESVDDPDAAPAWDEEAAKAVPDQVSFRVPTAVIAAKFGIAALIVLLSLLAPETSQLAVGLVAAAGVAIYAARDLIVRERLRADADGIVAVRGYAGHRQLAWSEIERLSVDTRTRVGARTNTLEIDADAEIFFFTRNDLGVEVPDALDTLETLRDR